MLATIRKVWMLTLGYVLTAASVQAQVESAILNQYVATAFASNEGIKQQNIQLEQGLNALKQAKSFYYPNVSFSADYMRAAGGRTIDLPIGDLMNPVYSTLNQLTHSNNFPTIKNESFQLNPDNYYDAKVRTAMPLINTEIRYNERIKKVLLDKNQAALNVYKRELAKNVKEAYLHYCQASNAEMIFANSLTLVNENVRVNKSLVKNGVKNNTVLLRSESEAEKLKAQLEEARNNKTAARLYFNFLLNRPDESEIIVDTTLGQNAEEDLAIPAGMNNDVLTQIATGEKAFELAKKMTQTTYVPKVATFLDMGSQGNNFKFDNKTAYFIWGINLKWDLFAGGMNNLKRKSYELEIDNTQSQYRMVRDANDLEHKQAWLNLKTNQAKYKSARTQLKMAQRYYNDQLKAYKEGTVLYIELVDALNQLTTAELQESISRANILLSRVQIERVNSLIDLNSIK